MTRHEDGFTLIELMVASAIFAIVSVGFYSVMFSSTSGSDTTRSVVRVSEEARLGFNRMVRDTREAAILVNASATSYQVRVDFNNDGLYENPNANGDFEDLTFALSGDKIMLNGETLIAGVTQIGAQDIFSYSSNRLEYDWSLPKDGMTTWQELDQAPAHGVTGVGNNNGVLDSGELPYVTSVSFAINVADGDRSTDFYAEAQLRNRR